MLVQFVFIVASAGYIMGVPLQLNSKVYEEANKFCIKDLKIKTIKSSSALDKTDPSYKCFNYCFQKRVGLIDGQANPIMSAIPANSNSTEVVSGCMKQNKEIDECAKANWMRECIKNGMIEKFDKQLAIFSAQCGKETNTVLTDYETMKKQALVNINNKKFNCFHRCVFIKTQILDEDNNFKVTHIDAMVKDLGVTGVDQIVTSCISKNMQTDKCEQAVKRNICIGTYGIMKYTFSEQKLKDDADLLY